MAEHHDAAAFVKRQNAVGSRRAAWSGRKETEGNEQQAAHTREYVAKVEAELQKICGGVLALKDKIAELSIEFGRRKYCEKTDLNERVKIMSEECGWDGTAMRCHSPETECATVVVDATRCLQYPIETHRARSNSVRVWAFRRSRNRSSRWSRRFLRSGSRTHRGTDCGRPTATDHGGNRGGHSVGAARANSGIVDVHVPEVMEEISEVLKFTPQAQPGDKVMDNPVAQQREMPTVQTAQNCA